MRLIACLAVLVAAAFTSAASANESEPPPLGTVPLAAPTGLRLLIPDLPPVLFDVDAERLTRVGGIDLKRARAVSTARVGRDAVLLVEKPHGGVLSQDIYVLRREATKAVRVASGAQLAPAQGGNAFWLKTYRSRNRCVLRRLTLAGRETRAPQPMSCSASVVDAGGRSVVVRGAVARDPANSRVVVRMPWSLVDRPPLWRIAGNVALAKGRSHRPIPLVDLVTGASEAVPWPSPQDLLDEASVHPSGELVAVGFADAIVDGPTSQEIDVWLLDVRTRTFSHLPDLPAGVNIKVTSMRWTDDGRLAWLANTYGRTVVADWRPGDAHIAVRDLPLLQRQGGLPGSFVVWSR